MNFSIHLEDELAEALNVLAKREARSRNALIREAVADFVARKKPGQWPTAVKQLAGVAPQLEPFENRRRELHDATEDPLR